MNKQKLGHAETQYGEKLHRFVQSNYLPRQISPKNHGKKVYISRSLKNFKQNRTGNVGYFCFFSAVYSDSLQQGYET